MKHHHLTTTFTMLASLASAALLAAAPAALAQQHDMPLAHDMQPIHNETAPALLAYPSMAPDIAGAQGRPAEARATENGALTRAQVRAELENARASGELRDDALMYGGN